MLLLVYGCGANDNIGNSGSAAGKALLQRLQVGDSGSTAVAEAHALCQPEATKELAQIVYQTVRQKLGVCMAWRLEEVVRVG